MEPTLYKGSMARADVWWKPDGVPPTERCKLCGQWHDRQILLATPDGLVRRQVSQHAAQVNAKGGWGRR